MSSTNGMCPHNNQANYCIACASQKSRNSFYGRSSFDDILPREVAQMGIMPQMGLDLNFSDALSSLVEGAKGAAGAYVVNQASKDAAVQQQVQAGVAQKVGDFIVKNKVAVGVTLGFLVIGLIYYMGKARRS